MIDLCLTFIDMEALEKHVEFNPAIKLKDIDKEKMPPKEKVLRKEESRGASSEPKSEPAREEEHFDVSGFAMFEEQAAAEKPKGGDRLYYCLHEFKYLKNLMFIN